MGEVKLKVHDLRRFLDYLDKEEAFNNPIGEMDVIITKKDGISYIAIGIWHTPDEFETILRINPENGLAIGPRNLILRGKDE